MNFQPDVSLQHLAAIAYSLSLLKEANIQIYLLQDVRHAHSSFYNNGIRYVSDSDLNKYCHQYKKKTENFLKKLKKKQLPKAILNQVLCVTESLLKRLRVWYEMVVKKFQIHHTYSDKVYWTCYGTIDIFKIISNEWTKWFSQDGELIKLPYEDRFETEICEDEVRVKALNMKLLSMGVALRRPITKESKMPYLFRADNARFAKYYMACACVWISYIKSHCYEMLQLCQMCSENDLKYDDIIEYVVCTVLFFSDAEKLKLEKFKTFYNSFKGIYEKLFKDLLFFEKKRTANQHMLSLSVDDGNYVAVKYYWKLLSLKEKDDLIVTTATDCLENLAWDGKSQGIMHSDTLIFLLSEMSEDQRKCFFNYSEVLDKEYRSHYVTIFLDLLLWEELFFPTFEALKFHFTKVNYYELLKQIAAKMTLKNVSNNMIFNNIKDKIGYDSERTIYYRMFVTVFEEMRKNPSNESALPLINKNFRGLEYISFKLFNIPILKLLMDFECEDSTRKSVLNPCKSDVKRDLFKMLVFENQYELLDKFVKAVLKSEEEIDWFKKCFRYSEDFITQDKIETLDNLLDWQSKSNEERRKLKYKAITELDLMGVCGKLFLKGRKFNINLAKKAKKWGFSDYQDRQNYLSEYKGDSLEWLNKIWRKYQNKKFREEEIIEAKTKTIKFLKFFLDTDDEVERFIKEKFININEVENFVPITNILISSFY